MTAYKKWLWLAKLNHASSVVSFKHGDAFEKQIQLELAVGLCDEFDFSFSLDFDKTIILLHPVPFI